MIENFITCHKIKNCKEFIDGVQAHYKESLDRGREYFYNRIKRFTEYSAKKFGLRISFNSFNGDVCDLYHHVFLALDDVFSKGNFGIMFTRGFAAIRVWVKMNKAGFMNLPVSEWKMERGAVCDKFLYIEDLESRVLDKLSYENTLEEINSDFIKEVISLSLHKLDREQLAVINGLYFNNRKRSDIYRILAGKLHKSEKEIMNIENEAYDVILSFIKGDDN